MTTELTRRVHTFFASLGPAALGDFAAGLADEAFRAGLTVYRADEARSVPIPVVITPEILAPAELAGLGADARTLLSAATRVARFTLTPPGEPLATRLYASFTPLEWECLRRDPSRLETVATARVDYFVDPAGHARALELNATIPAMQGYSDILAHTWIRALGRLRGMPGEPIEALVARCGSNSLDLLASLVEHYHRAGGKETRPSILIVSRPDDAQSGELEHYVRVFSGAGHRVKHVRAPEVEVDPRGRVSAGGESFDLLYRHIFARRVEAGSTLARLLVDPGPNIILNPVVSPLEVKGILALLSEAAAEEDRAPVYGLSAAHLDTVGRVVPWTRILGPGPATLPDGSRVPDLLAWVRANPGKLVIKRSWDYGGKSVLLGPDTPDWAERVDGAMRENEAWVVQELVPPRAVRHLLVARDDAGTVAPVWRDLFVDVSAYGNAQVASVPRGGACRASGAKIVNILGGGGLTPLVTADVVSALF